MKLSVQIHSFFCVENKSDKGPSLPRYDRQCDNDNRCYFMNIH